jgi:hypothetical protein
MGKHEIGYARVEADLYPTREPWVTQALLQYFPIRGLNVWEPAAGEGDMAEVLRSAGPAHLHCSDITERSYPLDQTVDFTSAILLNTAFDAVITNPPFGLRAKLAEQFITTGLKHIQFGGFLALLLPADFDSAARRRQYFAQCPLFTAKIVLTTRIVWFERHEGKREAPKENHAWYVWNRNHTGAPRIIYAGNPARRAAA